MPAYAAPLATPAATTIGDVISHLPSRAEMTIPAAPDQVRVLRAWARARLGAGMVGPSIVSDAVTVLSELAGNAVVHGPDSPILTVLHWGAAGLVVMVHDDGAGMPVLQARTPHATSGRGLWLVTELAQSWGTRRAASGKDVRALFTPMNVTLAGDG